MTEGIHILSVRETIHTAWALGQHHEQIAGYWHIFIVHYLEYTHKSTTFTAGYGVRMTNNVSFSTYKWLLPLSWIYGMVVAVRNWLFDAGWIESTSFPIPIVNVGNITIGGTGKTPHTEYLIRLLSSKWCVAVLSRGYGRQSSGYILAKADTPQSAIGDEPWQMKQKFPDVHIAVDANRRRGIRHLMNDPETRDTQVILLDDAYQHRYVKAGLNILLVNWHRPIDCDYLLPAGRLREPFGGRERADIVIVSKCPHDVQQIDLRMMQHNLRLKPFQRLYFSRFVYGMLYPLFTESEAGKLFPEGLKGHNVLLMSAIGCPKQMEEELRTKVKSMKTLTFPDHHDYTVSNMRWAEKVYKKLPEPRIVVTTEKDAARLKETMTYNDTEMHQHIYVLPITVGFVHNKQETFNKNITDYVQKNS